MWSTFFVCASVCSFQNTPGHNRTGGLRLPPSQIYQYNPTVQVLKYLTHTDTESFSGVVRVLPPPQPDVCWTEVGEISARCLKLLVTTRP